MRTASIETRFHAPAAARRDRVAASTRRARRGSAPATPSADTPEPRPGQLWERENGGRLSRTFVFGNSLQTLFFSVAAQELVSHYTITAAIRPALGEVRVTLSFHGTSGRTLPLVQLSLDRAAQTARRVRGEPSAADAAVSAMVEGMRVQANAGARGTAA